MLKYGDHFGVCINSNAELDISSYVSRFGRGITVEHDHRFTDKGKLINLCMSQNHAFEPGSLYGNMLGREMDHVFLFEELGSSIQTIAKKLGLNPADFPLAEEKPLITNAFRISDDTLSLIAAMHSLDYGRFDLR